MTVEVSSEFPAGANSVGNVSAALLASTADFTEGSTGGVLRTVLAKGHDQPSVRDYNAKGDGSTDDTAAFQAALAANRAVYVPPVDVEGGKFYKIATNVDFRGLHGRTLYGGGPRSLVKGTSTTKTPFGTHQVGDTLPQQATAYNLTGMVVPGSMSATLASSGDASNFASAAYGFVMCGNITTGVPMAELIPLAGVSGSTINFAKPAFGYYRDYGDGNGFTMAPVDAHCCNDLTIRDLAVQSDKVRSSYLLFGHNIRVLNCISYGNGGFVLRGRKIYADVDVDMTPDWSAGFRPYAFGVDCGTSDVWFRVRGSSKGVAIIHLHEYIKTATGSVNVRRGNVDVGTPEEWALVSVRGPSDNVTLEEVIAENIYHCGASNEAIITALGSAVMLTLGAKNFRLGSITARGIINNTNNNARILNYGAVQYPAVIGHVNVQDAKIDNAFAFGSGVIGYRPGMTIPIPWAAGGQAVNKMVLDTSVPGTAGTRNGESVVLFPDAVQTGAQCEFDIVQGIGVFTKATFTWEIVNDNGVGSANGFFRLFAKTNSTSANIDFSTGTTQIVATQAFSAAGCSRLITQTISLAATDLRVGCRIRRDATNAADTLDGYQLYARLVEVTLS